MAGGGSGNFTLTVALFAQRSRRNQEAMTCYAIGLAALTAIFAAFHLVRLLSQRSAIAAKLPSVAAPFIFMSRFIRKVSVRKAPFLPSTGHAAITIIYVVSNVVLSLVYLDTSILPYLSVLASRTGWLAIVNIALVVFLSLKNTPLAYLTAWSYERLNVLHQVAGYVTMILIIVHGVTYSSYFIGAGRISRLQVDEDIYGIVSGFTFLVVVLAGAVVRLWYYELFYILHLSGFAISMVLVGLHQPDLSKKIGYVTAAAAGIWLLDRGVRLARVVGYSVNNTATVHPLPNGGTRVVLKKGPRGARSGEHCLLWIPKIRLLEMHPFTIAATDPLEFVVNSHDGFTRDLHAYAVRQPGATLKASIEGSYGRFPNPNEYDKVVLIAGGSGASFTVGTALNLLKQPRRRPGQTVVFVWMVREHSRLEWFASHLATINNSLQGSMLIHVTRTAESIERVSSSEASSPANSPTTTTKFDMEKAIPQRTSTVVTRVVSDIEKSGFFETKVGMSPIVSGARPNADGGAPSAMDSIPVHYGRPDIAAIICALVDSAAPNQSVLVVGCGSDELMTLIRNTTAACIRTSGPAVELHCEQFGW